VLSLDITALPVALHKQSSHQALTIHIADSRELQLLAAKRLSSEGPDATKPAVR